MIANGITRALGITDLYHYKRLKTEVENYNAPIIVMPTECLSDIFLKEDQMEIADRNKSPQMIKMKMKETLGIFELIFDPLGEWTIKRKSNMKLR